MDMNNNQKNEETRRRRYEDKLYHNRMNKAFWTKRCIFLALFLALVAITLLLFFKQGWLVPKVVMIILLIIAMILDFLFLAVARTVISTSQAGYGSWIIVRIAENLFLILINWRNRTSKRGRNATRRPGKKNEIPVLYHLTTKMKRQRLPQISADFIAIFHFALSSAEYRMILQYTDLRAGCAIRALLPQALCQMQKRLRWRS